MSQNLEKLSYKKIIELAKSSGKLPLYEYVQKIIKISNSYDLSSRDVIELATHIGMKLYPRRCVFPYDDANTGRVINQLPDNWKPKLEESYFALSYQNPEDPLEYIVVAPSGPGFRPYIIYHTSDGYVDPNWFNDIVPILEQIKYEKRPSKFLSKMLKNQETTLGQINTLNHFFRQDPILNIEGICLKCYGVSLPDKGFGVKFSYRGNEIGPRGVVQELRYSARKISENTSQLVPYVMEIVIAGDGFSAENENGEVVEVVKGQRLWRIENISNTKSGCCYSTYPSRHETHIDARYYNFNKLKFSLPVCSCIQ